MKRLLIISLLLTFAYNFLGAGMVYNTWLYSIKKNVKERLQGEYEGKKILVKIPESWNSKPPAEFSWHEDDEFEYRGQMYDVIRKETHGSEIWYYCHRDKAETTLLRQLAQYVSRYLHQNSDEQQETNLLDSYLDQVFLASNNFVSTVPTLQLITFFDQNELMQHIFYDVDDPPPQQTMSALTLRLAS